MRVDDFDFELPEENIALRPVSPRDSARMLLVNQQSQGSLENEKFSNLANFLEEGDVLVFNDTRVIPAQLEGERVRNGFTASIGATLHMRMAPLVWRAYVRGAKKLKVGDHVVFGKGRSTEIPDGIVAHVKDKLDTGEIEFEFQVFDRTLDQALIEVGHIPLPPYIASKRPEDVHDAIDYQTVYAKENGAVAAPTAGLHFTQDTFRALKNKGIESHFVTLHVGAGTFLPVKVDDTDDHVMHSEIGVVSPETADALNAAKKRGGRIVSVGTTSLRLIESASSADGRIEAWNGSTNIFITPGYKFRAVDVLMTNFHLPRSTLFMLVSAFAGKEVMRQAYQHAIASDYRFYSYGDSSLLFRA